MIEGPTIGDWTQYGWIPDGAWSFPARVRLRDAAWMVYYEANVGDERERAEMLELREFAAHMANALGIDSEWRDTSWCDTDCMVEFGCQTAYCGGETRCPAWAKLHELGIEVDE